ncbi:MAG: sugar phosphate isomerase/epimerase [Chloroflexota bacterium]|nr:sugar phosphate isomerase/epimerase [Chloroflexota bacterium]PLS81659.1 MAG: xylose isomerase [Chloroflexota bacterium]
MWRLSGFADEISPDLDVQVETLLGEGIKHLEFRGVWGKNVLTLSDEEIESFRATLAQHGMKVSSIGSPIGKIKITDDFKPHLAAFDRALHIARTVEAPFIRIFSFFMPDGDDPARYREEVLDRLHQIVRRAEGSGITLLHENEKEIYGDIPSRCLDILTQINSPALRAAWDPANFVQCGVRPFTEGYAALQPFIAYIHVKDALLATGEVVPAGQGDGEWPQTIAALRDGGFDGFFSLEPHLREAGPFAGFSGPELFRTAVGALKGLLREQGIAWA